MPAPALPYGAISLSCSKKASGRVWTMAPRAVGAFAPRMRKAFLDTEEGRPKVGVGRKSLRRRWKASALFLEREPPPEPKRIASAPVPDPRQKGATSDQSGVRLSPKSEHPFGTGRLA